MQEIRCFGSAVPREEKDVRSPHGNRLQFMENFINCSSRNGLDLS